MSDYLAVLLGIALFAGSVAVPRALLRHSPYDVSFPAKWLVGSLGTWTSVVVVLDAAVVFAYRQTGAAELVPVLGSLFMVFFFGTPIALLLLTVLGAILVWRGMSPMGGVLTLVVGGVVSLVVSVWVGLYLPLLLMVGGLDW